MFNKLMRYAAVPLFALTLVLWGCEDAGQLTGPGEVSRELVETSNSSGYKMIKETDASTGVVSGTIDQNGGKLVLGQHSLAVPAGAVDGPTLFTMTKLDGAMQFDLTATRVTTNDIGSAGFATPLVLTIDYTNATELPEDQSKLKVFWKKTDGTYEAQPSEVDIQGKRLRGKLSHFSEYTGGWLLEEL